MGRGVSGWDRSRKPALGICNGSVVPAPGVGFHGTLASMGKLRACGIQPTHPDSRAGVLIYSPEGAILGIKGIACCQNDTPL